MSWLNLTRACEVQAHRSCQDMYCECDCHNGEDPEDREFYHRECDDDW